MVTVRPGDKPGFLLEPPVQVRDTGEPGLGAAATDHCHTGPGFLDILIV